MIHYYACDSYILRGGIYANVYFQGYLMGTDLMERTLPLPFSITGAGKLKLMSIHILLEGQEKELLSLC